MRHWRSGNTNVEGGFFNQPADFYEPAETIVDGAVTKGWPDVPTWRARVNLAPFQAFEQRDAQREVGQIWAIISIRYAPSRQPLEGWKLIIASSGEEYEIRGVRHVDGGRKKLELTCQLYR